MSATETRADEKDRSTRANDARTAAPDQTRDAEARTRRLEEIRQAVVEEWRWRDPERGECGREDVRDVVGAGMIRQEPVTPGAAPTGLP